jgi:hypothetical protein
MPYRSILTALFTIALLILHPNTVSAQIANPVKWSFTSKKINATTYELHMTATLDTGWRIYAQQAGEGPVPTSFKLSKNPLATPSGKIAEVGKLMKSFDTGFDNELKYYEKTVDFVQKVTLKGKSVTNVKGTVEFMAGDGKQVLPPKQVDFSIKIGN